METNKIIRFGMHSTHAHAILKGLLLTMKNRGHRYRYGSAAACVSPSCVKILPDGEVAYVCVTDWQVSRKDDILKGIPIVLLDALRFIKQNYDIADDYNIRNCVINTVSDIEKYPLKNKEHRLSDALNFSFVTEDCSSDGPGSYFLDEVFTFEDVKIIIEMIRMKAAGTSITKIEALKKKYPAEIIARIFGEQIANPMIIETIALLEQEITNLTNERKQKHDELLAKYREDEKNMSDMYKEKILEINQKIIEMKNQSKAC